MQPRCGIRWRVGTEGDIPEPLNGVPPVEDFDTGTETEEDYGRGAPWAP